MKRRPFALQKVLGKGIKILKVIKIIKVHKVINIIKNLKFIVKNLVWLLDIVITIPYLCSQIIFTINLWTF